MQFAGSTGTAGKMHRSFAAKNAAQDDKSRRGERTYLMSLASEPRNTYTPEEVDFIVAWVIPEDVWYVLPIAAVRSIQGLVLRPHDTRPLKYERYREAWCLLACAPTARGWNDIPILCRGRTLPADCAVCPEK